MLLKTLLKCSFFLFVWTIQAQNFTELGIHDFNFDWEFKLEETTSTIKNPLYKDWTKINVPHDWSVYFAFDNKSGEGATGFLPGGVGVYKKNFSIAEKENTTTYLLFDGIYNSSEVVLNDTILGVHPYGYSPFYFDISEHLKKDNTANTLKIKVNRKKYVDSRWYTGSGIYRNVKLIRKNKLHVPIWGTFITTPVVSATTAVINIKSTIRNNYSIAKNFDFKVTILDDSSNIIATVIKPYDLDGSKEQLIEENIEIKTPYLWAIDSPRMYHATISVIENEIEVDTNSINFGVRSIKFDANTGFFLNNKNTKIKGVCLHNDGGLVGSAVPKDVWRRRLEKLKEAGCNAIRISHHPGSEEFLDLCDEMGFLVQDEFFDEWDNPKDKRHNMNEKSIDIITRGYTEYFQEWAEKDLKNTIAAHRNHPSIFQWSIGNEIEWTYPRNQVATGFFDNMDWSGNYFWEEPPYNKEKIKEKLETLPKDTFDIGHTANKLANWTRELDSTRYITANCILPSASHLSGYTDALDVVGYSYRRVLYDYGHKNYPDKPIMGTESLVQWHEWKAILERPFIAGTFLWTGIDYMGESHNQWPRKATPSGMLDVAGFKKPSFHMIKTLWNDNPHLYIATQSLEQSIYKEDQTTNAAIEKKEGGWEKALWIWHEVKEHWNYKKNQKIVVEVYSNCDEVEMFLNEKSLGIKKLEEFEDRIYKWIVPFEKGSLKAIGRNNGEIVEEHTIHSSGKSYQIKLTTDKTELLADGYNVAHVIAQVVDEQGHPIKNAESEISFSIDGNATILGVDNGSAYSVQDYKSNTVKTNKGQCLLLVQSKKVETNLSIRARSEKLTSNILKIQIK